MLAGVALLFPLLLKIAGAGITYTVGNNLPRSAFPLLDSYSWKGVRAIQTIFKLKHSLRPLCILYALCGCFNSCGNVFVCGYAVIELKIITRSGRLCPN